MLDDFQVNALLEALAGLTLALRVNFLPVYIVAFFDREILVTGCLTVTVHVAEMFEPSVVLAVIITLPALTPLTTPFDTVAIFVLEDVQARVLLSAFAGVTVAFTVTFLPTLTVATFLFSATPLTATGVDGDGVEDVTVGVVEDGSVLFDVFGTVVVVVVSVGFGVAVTTSRVISLDGLRITPSSTIISTLLPSATTQTLLTT